MKSGLLFIVLSMLCSIVISAFAAKKAPSAQVVGNCFQELNCTGWSFNQAVTLKQCEGMIDEHYRKGGGGQFGSWTSQSGTCFKPRLDAREIDQRSWAEFARFVKEYNRKHPQPNISCFQLGEGCTGSSIPCCQGSCRLYGGVIWTCQ